MLAKRGSREPGRRAGLIAKGGFPAGSRPGLLPARVPKLMPGTRVPVGATRRRASLHHRAAHMRCRLKTVSPTIACGNPVPAATRGRTRAEGFNCSMDLTHGGWRSAPYRMPPMGESDGSFPGWCGRGGQSLRIPGNLQARQGANRSATRTARVPLAELSLRRARVARAPRHPLGLRGTHPLPPDRMGLRLTARRSGLRPDRTRITEVKPEHGKSGPSLIRSTDHRYITASLTFGAAPRRSLPPLHAGTRCPPPHAAGRGHSAFCQDPLLDGHFPDCLHEVVKRQRHARFAEQPDPALRVASESDSGFGL